MYLVCPVDGRMEAGEEHTSFTSIPRLSKVDLYIRLDFDALLVTKMTLLPDHQPRYHMLLGSNVRLPEDVWSKTHQPL
jgi:hypothetical protein